ncbi:MAG: hypothetical protein NVS3B26_14380 [Mycobacteriales bacterium]
MVAAAAGAAGVAICLPLHLSHIRVARVQQRVLVDAAQGLQGASVVSRSAEHHTIGYANLTPGGEQTCAAEASLLVETAESPEQVRAAMERAPLPNLVVSRTARSRLRIEIFQPFGENPLDWSCWQ